MYHAWRTLYISVENFCSMVSPFLIATGSDCDVRVISHSSIDEVLTAAYHYNTSLTPVIHDVFPRRGGTGGGTLVTITGENFGLVLSFASAFENNNNNLIYNIFSNVSLQGAL